MVQKNELEMTMSGQYSVNKQESDDGDSAFKGNHNDAQI